MRFLTKAPGIFALQGYVFQVALEDSLARIRKLLVPELTRYVLFPVVGGPAAVHGFIGVYSPSGKVVPVFEEMDGSKYFNLAGNSSVAFYGPVVDGLLDNLVLRLQSQPSTVQL